MISLCVFLKKKCNTVYVPQCCSYDITTHRMEYKTRLLPQSVQLDQFERIKLSVNTEKTKSKKLLNSFTYMYSVHVCSLSFFTHEYLGNSTGCCRAVFYTH